MEEVNCSNSKIFNTYGPSETTCFNTYFRVQKINKKYGVTIIYVTHNEEFAKTANVSYTIKDGKCIKN